MERPPAPPEAVLIRLAREAAGITVAEAAKTAGVSVARWSQIEAGSEMRHGQVSPVTGKAGTIARMAHAVPRISPERLAAEGRRPDAAEILREIVGDAGPAPKPDASRVDFSGDDPEAHDPFVRDILAEAHKVLDDLTGGMLPDPSDPDAADIFRIPGALIFDEREARIWDDPRLSRKQRIDIMAYARRLMAKASEQERRRTGLSRIAAAGNHRVTAAMASPVSVAPEAFRASS